MFCYCIEKNKKRNKNIFVKIYTSNRFLLLLSFGSQKFKNNLIYRSCWMFKMRSIYLSIKCIRMLFKTDLNKYYFYTYINARPIKLTFTIYHCVECEKSKKKIRIVCEGVKLSCRLNAKNPIDNLMYTLTRHHI